MTREMPRYKCERCGRIFRIKKEAVEHEKKCPEDNCDNHAERKGTIYLRYGRAYVVAKEYEMFGKGKIHMITKIELLPGDVCIKSFKTTPLNIIENPEMSFSDFTGFCEEAKFDFNNTLDKALEQAKKWIENASREKNDQSEKEKDKPDWSKFDVCKEQVWNENEPDSQTMTCPKCKGRSRNCSYCKGLGKVTKRVVL
ncbi:hypothetical protein Mpt1_c08620 [Candidatus Methanoplasma termitum]|uniref:C2H2-type domain-containing protein n=1 Tax=Candidatus Methanoplasma termitum TaxID=1577791 RepID=A0A0A7LCL7_9ARCH|nr:hypothetical protein [Candidatus Methanoplasma termitum]AIZ56738.1 hypothetical protein Mpt1_c08620 [Candidatus Methanoplasma termitum]